MAKKTTLDELGQMVSHLVKHMLTKDDVRDIVHEEMNAILPESLKPIEKRLLAVESKIVGIDRRLDAEAMRRDDEKLPMRVAVLEKKMARTT